MTTTAQSHSRREADRLAYEDYRCAAHQKRTDALGWQKHRDELVADPKVYGPRSGDYLAGVRARIDVVIAWIEHEASIDDDYADTYRALLGAE